MNSIPPDDRQTCLRVLQQLADAPELIDDDIRFKTLIAKIHRTGKRRKRRGGPPVATDTEATKSHSTTKPYPIGSTSQTSAYAISASSLRKRRCYVCKNDYRREHHFYHLLCPDCATLNFAKRSARTCLDGRVALITGGRIKIGFEVAVKLLRDGADVHVTTRFPLDAAERFRRQDDFDEWSGRLKISALDLLDLPSVHAFADAFAMAYERLDILIHNAAQTIRRPASFYARCVDVTDPRRRDDLVHHFASVRMQPSSGSSAVKRLSATGWVVEASDLAQPSSPIATATDAFGQPIDPRAMNSWRLKIGEVSTVELLESYLVTAAAPFIITSRLLPMMRRVAPETERPRKFIINVSAMEGQFARRDKTAHHPHTNMAKAAMNMMTRTAAGDLAKEAIYMNSVDTGWITDENPHPIASQIRRRYGFRPPLDVIDGASRIYDPIVTGLSDDATPMHGRFLKDYRVHDW